MWDAQVLLQDLSPKGKIGLTIKGKRNHVLKIQGLLLAILTFFVKSFNYYFDLWTFFGKNPQFLLKQLASKLKDKWDIQDFQDHVF